MTTDSLEGEGRAVGAVGPPREPVAAPRRRDGRFATRRHRPGEGNDFEVKGLVLLDAAGNHPVSVHALTFGDDGIGLVGREGSSPRVLPWTSVATHAVEPWTGGTVPQWWVDSGQRRKGTSAASEAPGQPGDGTPVGAVEPRREAAAPDRAVRTGGSPLVRSLPHVEPGALIDIRTPSGTFRFLLPRADPAVLAERISAVAVRHHGPAAASSVTRTLADSRRTRLRPVGVSGWARVQPFLVVLLVVVIAAAVTLILLQSAGAVHLPFLGGPSSGLPAWRASRAAVIRA